MKISNCTKTKFLLLTIFMLFFSCTSKKEQNNIKIEKTVKKFWTAVENNNAKEYGSLFYNSEGYPGVISSELYFMNKHKKLIKPKIRLQEKIAIKDTLVYATNTKEQYVQYVFKNEKDSLNYSKPLIITLMFSDLYGYDYLNSTNILENHIGFDK